MGFIRTAPVTVALAVLLVVVFAYQWMNRGSYDYVTGSGRLPATMLNYGVFPSAVRAGEWWRLVTAGFLHASVMHIALNLWGLLYAGAFVEKWYGQLRLIAIFIVAVIGGDIAAAFTSSERTVTVGASGGIVGLFAAFALVGIKFWSQRDELTRGAIPLMATLFNGFAHPSVSNAAHIGGAITGGACAWFIGVAASMRALTLERETKAIAASAEFERRLAPPPLDAADSAHTIKLRMTRRRQAAYLVMALGLLGLGVFLWLDEPSKRDLLRSAGAALFALMGVGIIANLRTARLELSPDGFTVRAVISSRHVRWYDVLPTFVVGSVSGNPMVFYRFRPEVEAARRGWGVLNAGTQRVPAIYGLSALEQAQLMAETYKKWMLPREESAPSA